MVFCLLSARALCAEVCTHQPMERAALSGAVLRTALMVAALTCNNRLDYNEVVRRFEGKLIEQGHRLKNVFRRQYGANADLELDRFITRLANEESRRSIESRAAFCSDAASLFDQLLNGRPESAEVVLNDPTLLKRHHLTSCEGSPTEKSAAIGAAAPARDLRK